MDILKVKVNNEWVGIPAIEGTPGEDGYSPTASVTKSGDTATITITDKNGTTTAQVQDGDDYVLTQQDKEDIAAMIDAPVTDVQVNGTSIVNNGVANVPIASDSALGAVKVNSGYGVMINPYTGDITVSPASSANAKSGAEVYKPITPVRQHESVFYGLAKAAGDSTQSSSSNAVGNYTAEAKAAIKAMLDAAGTAEVKAVEEEALGAYVTNTATGAVVNFTDGADNVPVKDLTIEIVANQSGEGDPSPSNIRPISGWTRAVISHSGTDTSNPVTYTVNWETEAGTIYGGTLDVTTGVLTVTMGYINITGGCTSIGPTPTGNKVCLVGQLQDAYYELNHNTVKMASTMAVYPDGNALYTNLAPSIGIASSNKGVMIIAPTSYNFNSADDCNAWLAEHPTQIIYQLAAPQTYQLAPLEITTLLSNNTIYADTGNSTITYRVEPKKSPVQDVQINGSTILSNETANIPLASSSTIGVSKADISNGIGVTNAGALYLQDASDAQVKAGTAQYRPISPRKQDAAAFYGMAKAAGDNTQSASDNPVGTYTDNAKEAIRSMIGAGTYSKPNSGIPSTDLADGVIPDISGKMDKVNPTGSGTFSIGRKANTTIGANSFAMGNDVEASGYYSFAVGALTVASTTGTVATGVATSATGPSAHAEGISTIASGGCSHAEGSDTVASGIYSHSEGYGTKATSGQNFAHGIYNIPDNFTAWPEWISGTFYSVGDLVKVTTINNGETIVDGYACKTANSDVSFTSSNWNKYIIANATSLLEIVGNGNSNNDRSNAYALDYLGNGRVCGCQFRQYRRHKTCYGCTNSRYQH